MSFWKQLLLCLVLVAIAAGAWIGFVPGSRETLARWGIDVFPAASARTTPDEQTAARGSGGAGGQPAGPRAGGPQQGGVIVGNIQTATINDRLTAIGTGRAYSSVSVRPFSSGRMTDVVVQSGDRVEKGEVLARLDSQSEQIAVDRARVALDDANATLVRTRTLRSANTASAVQVTEAELTVRNAELALREAELALDRREIEAPISGVVGILPITAGNYVTTETEVATIDDRSRILVDFWAPERFAAQVAVGQPVRANLIARPGERFAGEISAVDNRIDPDSRTLKIEARITNPDDKLRAGMSFQVTVEFPGDTYPAVDPLAVQWSTEGAYVWAVRDGAGTRVPVQIVQRNADSILVNAEFQPDDEIVVEGLHLVRPGQPLTIAGRRETPAATDAQATATTAAGN